MFARPFFMAHAMEKPQASSLIAHWLFCGLYRLKEAAALQRRHESNKRLAARVKTAPPANRDPLRPQCAPW
jgi:hypothetical protein